MYSSGRPPLSGRRPFSALWAAALVSVCPSLDGAFKLELDNPFWAGRLCA